MKKPKVLTLLILILVISSFCQQVALTEIRQMTGYNFKVGDKKTYSYTKVYDSESENEGEMIIKILKLVPVGNLTGTEIIDNVTVKKGTKFSVEITEVDDTFSYNITIGGKTWTHYTYCIISGAGKFFGDPYRNRTEWEDLAKDVDFCSLSGDILTKNSTLSYPQFNFTTGQIEGFNIKTGWIHRLHVFHIFDNELVYEWEYEIESEGTIPGFEIFPLLIILVVLVGFYGRKRR
ncbi:MAG: hypothetical protein JSV04_12550 [Candidatus Heimdallarchaeota archaeon]|nr:MAG: hypothetical protein JSV04_12550 [Candidatus Heimdallarchaeota archaeon]